ncbi:sulfide:quinone oxidoreductase [Acinetobacter lwoffii]|uniref:Sulfide:quinone oxidoreductase n=1 Tax=Acinetobacter lwoffii TaxID=28090 RepID=A0AAW8LDB3_ACILW|nr:sulfur transferase domain-containing protein [Acinetobacter lwoffii]MDR6630655.1 sulfide:quinone oxidoreductase [Acinetobacter lwoffii]
MTNLFWKGVVLASCLSCASLVVAANDLSRALTSTVSVTGQMTPSKFEQLIQQGFKSVIINRPDQETGNAVTVSQLRSIAEKSQVSVIYQPVVSGQLSQANIEEFARYYNELPKPILMVCRSGTRSAALFNQARSQGLIHE